MLEKIALKINKIYKKVKIKLINFITKNDKGLPRKMHYFDGSLYDAINATSQKYPYNIAIEYADKQFTYKELLKKINKCAKALRTLGVEKKDCVTVCMPNTPEAVIFFYAINEIGAVANMIHPLSSEKEIEFYLNRSNSKVMLCIDIAYPKVKSIVNNTKLEKVIVSSATKSMERLTAVIYWFAKGRKLNVREDNKIMLWDHFIQRANNYHDDPYVKVNKKDAAIILYSGGTTGKPKGVLISNFAFNAQALQCRYVFDVLTLESSVLTFLPNFHAFGLGICTHVPLYHGMKAILIPQFNIKKFKSYLRKYHFDVIAGVPSIFDAISKMKFRKNELKGIRLVVCGGDSLTLPIKQNINACLKKYGSSADIRVGYGLTESSGVIAISPEKVLDEADVIGYAFPDHEFKIVSIETGEEIKDGSDGEICVTGPNLMMEYLDEPEETLNVLKKENHKVWLHTGDIGYIDKQGLLHYRSRLKRMIITNGYNVYPSHVEEIIMQHEAVANCAVIGVKHEVKGEIVKAFIVLKDDQDGIFDKSSLQKHLKEHLARYEIPKEIRYVDDLPKTIVGKVAYKELEKMD